MFTNQDNGEKHKTRLAGENSDLKEFGIYKHI